MEENGTDIFKKNMLERYMNRPDRNFKKGKYAALDNLCYAQFLANYYLDSKNKKTKEEENDYQPEVLEELINDLSTLPKSVPLMVGKEYLKLRKTKCVLRFHVPSKLKKPEAYAHHLFIIYYPFRKEEELKGEFGTYGEKLIDPDIIECIRTNQRIFEPFSELSMMRLKISIEMQEDLICRENKKMMILQMTIVGTTIMMKIRTRKYITVEPPFNLYNP